MRIGIDLNARQSPRITIPRAQNGRGSARPNASFNRGTLLGCLALIALCAGCNAVVNFGDFKFGPLDDPQRDSGTADSGAAADGGEADSGSVRPDQDASVRSNKDAGGGTSDGSVVGAGDSGSPDLDSSVHDAGDVDSGHGDPDSGMMSCSSVVEICDNGIDDDCDGHSDCDDPDCAGQGNCCSSTPENTQAECRDNRDNDCNGKTDCSDLNCSGTLACCTPVGPESTPTACADGIDNDCDGKVDCVDSDCAGMGSCCAFVVQSLGTGMGTTSCCTPDGLNEADAPNDGKDNDCDGLTDIPILMSAFPIQGLPSSADEVRLNFMTEINPMATLACSTTRPNQPQSFSACPLVGTTVKPFTAVQSANPMNNGLWITQVRWDFPDGTHSSSYTFRYYVHSSLHNVSHCTPFHTDAQWFSAANTRLGVTDAGTFKLGVDTFLASPFILVKYQVPISGKTEFLLTGQTPQLEMWSLRRRFTLNATNKYLLIQRNYKATRSGSCSAAAFQIHDTHAGTNHTFRTYTCDAVVLNRAGVGVCLDNGTTSAAGPVITASKSSNEPAANAIGWQSANKFMWRQLLEHSAGKQSAGHPRNFTAKCATQPCAGIFLPDRIHFAP